MNNYLGIMNDFEIKTERLVITNWEFSDFEDFKALATNPKVIRYIGEGKLWSDEKIIEALQRQNSLVKEYGFCFGALRDRHTKNLMGLAGIQPLGNTKDYEIGWWLAPEYWKQGFGIEAAKAIVNFAFNRLQLPRVKAIVHPENIASKRIIEKLGMKLEGDVTGQDLGLIYPRAKIELYCLENDKN